jgi:hypothetical protein
MCKIDKEKLLKEFRGVGSMYLSDVRRVIKNFLEEQEIDFDALWKEFNEICLKKDCDNCTYPNKLYYTTICFVDFLKSKNLTVPKLVEIPVKKTWTLKKEYEDFCTEFLLQSVKTVMSVEPVGASKKYYDLHEEPDYSKIPKGSIVEIEFVGSNGNNCGYVNGITNKSISIGFHMLYNSGNSTTINFDQIKSIVILKLAKE